MPSVPRESAAIRVARALGDPTRFRLLKHIAARDEASCVELTALARLAQATVSHHLKVLSDAGLVSVRKEGAFHFYRFRPEVLDAHGAALSAAFAPSRRRARAAAAGRAP
jgi:ArsR family transcriptional regulator, arsenate/arsenite/antimonite-responsive transcriptional repressor